MSSEQYSTGPAALQASYPAVGPVVTVNGNGAHGDGEDVLAELEAGIIGYKPEPAASTVLTERLQKRGAEVDALLLSAQPSDHGNARCVLALYPERFLYGKQFGGWLFYTGTHWKRVEEQIVKRFITQTLLKRIEAVSTPEQLKQDDANAKQVRKFCLPNKGRVEGCKDALATLVAATQEEFQPHPELLNCANGVVNLKTGGLTPHAPAQRFLYCTPTAYKRDADSSTWRKWLTETLGSEALTEHMQLCVGYSLTGYTREEVLFYLYGPARAGKGLFTETLGAMLGAPLSVELSFATFTAPREADVQNFDLAPLKPARVVFASEANEYERFNAGKLKQITGGGEIRAAFKYGDPFNYRPGFKIWLTSNTPINADPEDDAVWGRFRVFEFPHSHLGKEDKTLKQAMLEPANLEGLLAWAVEGALKWFDLGAAGLPEPETLLTLKDTQRRAGDTLTLWLEECATATVGGFTSSKALYKNYEEWCKDNGVEPKRHKGFAQALERRGYTSTRDYVAGKQVRGYKGLGLLQELPAKV